MNFAPYSNYPSFTRRWISGPKASRSGDLQPNIVIVHDFDEPEFESPSTITYKDRSFAEVLREDFHHAGILSVRPIVEPVANWFATQKSFQAQASELLATIEHERVKRGCDSEIVIFGIGAGVLIVKQALAIADRECGHVNFRQKISYLGFVTFRDQACSERPLGASCLDIALRLNEQCKWSDGTMLGHLFATVRETDRQFLELSPKYQTIVAQDTDIVWTTTSRPTGDLWQALSDALRQATEARLLDATPRSQSYCSILSKFSMSHFQHTRGPEPWQLKYPELKSTSVYLAWAQSKLDNAILYLHGPYGSEKSPIARSIYAECASSKESALAVFFSFDDFDHPRKSSNSLLYALIFQILSKFPSAFQSIQRHAHWISTRPVLSVNELFIIVRALMSFPNFPLITLIIDDVDQCEDNVFECLEDLTKLAKGTRAPCKVLVTSCLPPTLSSHWDKFILSLDNENRAQGIFSQYHDHTCVGKEVIGALKRFQSPTEACIRLKALLASPFAGTTLDRAEPILDMPLHDLYAQSIGHLEGLKPWVLTALSWITYSFRPLSLDELMIALITPTSNLDRDQANPFLPSEIEVELLHTLGSMIEVREGKVHFADPLVGTFAKLHLNGKVNAPSAFPEVAILTHAGITRRCLQYLKLSASGLKEPTIENRLFQGSKGRSFESYAAMYWSYHYNAAEDKSILVQDVLEFFASGQPCDLWVQRWSAYHNIDPHEQAQSTPLVLAAQHGLSEVARDLLLKDGGEASVPERSTAFEAALQFHQVHVAHQLLQFTASSEKALLLTAGMNDLELARDVFRGTEHSDTVFSKCVGKAAFHGHREVIDVLFELFPDEASFPGNGASVLIESINGGHLHIIEHLLNARDRPLSNETSAILLNLAAEVGDLEIFEFLVSKGMSIKDSNEDGVTCLHSAVAANNTGLVRDLMSDISPNAKDCNGNTPLHIACIQGSSFAFDELITNASVDINIINEKGEKPVHLAAQNGNIHMVMHLLEMGVSKSDRNGEQFDPLHLAVRGGHLDLVRTILNWHPGQTSRTAVQMGHSSVGGGILDDHSANDSDLSDEFSVESSETASGTNHFPARQATTEGRESGSEMESYNTANESQVEEEESEEEKETDEEEEEEEEAAAREHEKEPTPLHSAARGGYVAIMRELFKFSIDVNLGNRFGSTPLHFAAKGGHGAATKLILEIGNNPNVSDNQGCLPIHLACEAGNSRLLMYLIESGSSTDKPDTRGRVPLHVCAEYEHEELAQVLLSTGVNVNALNPLSGESALHISAKFGHSATSNILIKHGANLELKDGMDQTPLHLALLRGHAEMSVSLMNGGADLGAMNAQDQIPLLCAVSGRMDSSVINRILSGYRNMESILNEYPSLICEAVSARCEKDVIALLMRAGWSSFARNKDRRTPLSLALDSKRFTIAMQLLEPLDADLPPIEEYSKALLEMTRSGFVEGVQWILKYPDVDIEVGGGIYCQTPLAVAAEHGMTEILESLLDRNANADARDMDGYTPVMLALGNGHIEAACLLFSHGADVDAKANNGITILDFAAQSGKREIVDLALDQGTSVPPGLLAKCVRNKDHLMVETMLCRGSSPFQSDSEGKTAIHEALEDGDPALLEKLVTHGITKIDGDQGWTALHLAAMIGQVGLLHVHKAHIKTGDSKGRTALHWAASRGHVDAVKTLSDLKADSAAQDHQGMTALHLAAANGCEDVVRNLIESLSPLDVQDKYKWKAVHHADACGHRKIVSRLENSYLPLEKPEAGSSTGWAKDSQRKAVLVMNDGCKVIIDSAIDDYLSTDVHMRTEYPVPPKNGVLYYELEICQLSTERTMGLGLCTESSIHEGMPGWEAGSLGYHADDGCLFAENGNGQNFGPQYFSGDVVGCGFDFHEQWAFFTHKGTLVGKRKWEPREMLYPVLGFGQNGCEVTTNFGKDEFKYKGLDGFGWRQEKP